MKKTLSGIAMVVLLFAAFCVLNGCQSTTQHERQTTTTDSTITSTTPADTTAITITSASHKDASYTINGGLVKLTNGMAETAAAPGSASKIITQYEGNEINADLNNDGRLDVIFLLTQTTGGTGIFYYVVAALHKENGYHGSHGFLLGDRILPQSIALGHNNNLVVNYKDRKPGEGFAVQPSVAKSTRLILDTVSMQFGEVAKDFEGEANPSRMTPGMKTWEWTTVTYNDGKIIKPKKPKTFTLSIKTDGTFAATTDCNRLSGKVVIKNKSIQFSDIVSTRMFCEGSQEADFQKVLEQAVSYFFTSKGEMVFDLAYDSGSAQFK
jgi:heat shock protein HslJ